MTLKANGNMLGDNGKVAFLVLGDSKIVIIYSCSYPTHNTLKISSFLHLFNDCVLPLVTYRYPVSMGLWGQKRGGYKSGDKDRRKDGHVGI